MQKVPRLSYKFHIDIYQDSQLVISKCQIRYRKYSINNQKEMADSFSPDLRQHDYSGLNQLRRLHLLEPIQNKGNDSNIMTQSHQLGGKNQSGLSDPEQNGDNIALATANRNEQLCRRDPHKSKSKIKMYGSKTNLLAYTAIINSGDGKSQLGSEKLVQNQNASQRIRLSGDDRPSTSHDRSRKKVIGCGKKVPPSLTMIFPNPGADHDQEWSRPQNKINNGSFIKKQSFSKQKVIGRQKKITAKIDQIQESSRLMLNKISNQLNFKQCSNVAAGSNQSCEGLDIQRIQQTKKKFLYEDEIENTSNDLIIKKDGPKVKAKSIHHDEDKSLQNNNSKCQNLMRETDSQQQEKIKPKHQHASILVYPKIPSVILTPSKKIKAHIDYVLPEGRQPRSLRHGHFFNDDKTDKLIIVPKAKENQQKIQTGMVHAEKKQEQAYQKWANQQKIEERKFEAQKKFEQNDHKQLKKPDEKGQNVFLLKQEQPLAQKKNKGERKQSQLIGQKKRPSVILSSNKSLRAQFDFIQYNDSTPQEKQVPSQKPLSEKENSKSKIVVSSSKSINAYFQYIEEQSQGKKQQEQSRKVIKSKIDFILQQQIISQKKSRNRLEPKQSSMKSVGSVKVIPSLKGSSSYICELKQPETVQTSEIKEKVENEATSQQKKLQLCQRVVQGPSKITVNIEKEQQMNSIVQEESGIKQCGVEQSPQDKLKFQNQNHELHYEQNHGQQEQKLQALIEKQAINKKKSNETEIGSLPENTGEFIMGQGKQFIFDQVQPEQQNKMQIKNQNSEAKDKADQPIHQMTSSTILEKQVNRSTEQLKVEQSKLSNQHIVNQQQLLKQEAKEQKQENVQNLAKELKNSSIKLLQDRKQGQEQQNNDQKQQDEVDLSFYPAQDKINSKSNQQDDHNDRALHGLAQNGLSNRSLDSNQGKKSLRALVRVSPRHLNKQGSESKIQQKRNSGSLTELAIQNIEMKERIDGKNRLNCGAQNSTIKKVGLCKFQQNKENSNRVRQKISLNKHNQRNNSSNNEDDNENQQPQDSQLNEKVKSPLLKSRNISKKIKLQSPYFSSAFSALRLGTSPKKKQSDSSFALESEKRQNRNQKEDKDEGSHRIKKQRQQVKGKQGILNERQIERLKMEYEKIKKKEHGKTEEKENSLKLKHSSSNDGINAPKEKEDSYKQIRSHKYLKAHSHQFSYLYPTAQIDEKEKLHEKVRELDKKLKRSSHLISKKRDHDEVHEYISEARKQIMESEKYLTSLDA